jgi:hypothetical protein|tara:strand:- start:119 stop:484 length:366 start_codon:yes stop_codon:yes gene_type:complete
MRHNKQKGITALGGLTALLLVGFFMTAAFKVGPLYLDNSFIRAALDSLAHENIHTLTDKDVRRKLYSSFDINNVRGINKNDIKVIREKTKTLVTLNYEKRVEFMGNVDVVVRFENTYDSSK